MKSLSDSSGSKSRCTHPVGGGSYTCISFGDRKAPIFAFHTVQDSQNRVTVGTGSGFQEDDDLSGNSVETIRRKRKLFQQVKDMELAKILKERQMQSLVEPTQTLPVTSYQRVKRKLEQEALQEEAGDRLPDQEVKPQNNPVQP